MADVQAFRGYRYDLGKVGDLSNVIAPPYDVIDAGLQQALFDRSPYNVLHADLSRDRPDDTENHNRYTRAARTLREWVADGVLAHDSARTLYVYEQEYTVEGQTHVRRGFIARVRLEPFGEGRIFPHEETLAGPKADRLSLYRATAMNLSPIFGLYPDAQSEVLATVDELTRRQLPLEARDHLGTISRVWPITDQHVIGQVCAAMGPKPIFIADGHHRYETGLAYRNERLAAGEVVNAEAAPNYIMMMLVSMSDPGLLILPTHRLVSGLPGLTAPQLAERLSSHFDLQTVDSMRDCWESIELDGSQNMLGFGTRSDGAWQVATLREPDAMAELAPEHSDAWRELAVAVLHKLVLGKLVTGATSTQYVHLLSEVEQAYATRSCDLAVLVPPATMSHVEEIAGNWEKMPPKSTYFYPKLLSGLVFNSLKVN